MDSFNTFSDARLIWGAGLRRDAAATDRLLALLRATPPAASERLFALAWSLGRLGEASAIAPLRVLASQATQPTVRRMATEAVRALLSGDALAAFQQAQREKLPVNLQASMVDAPTLEKALRRHLGMGSSRNRSNAQGLLYSLYLIGDEMCREVLRAILPEVPLVRGWMQPVRYLFKAAEYREDPLFFGLLARRFDECQASGADGQPWSVGTRTYLRRRVCRTLRRLASAGDASVYASMAAGVLLAYDHKSLLKHCDVSSVPVALRPLAQQRGEKPPQLIDEAYAFNVILYGGQVRLERPGTGSWRAGVQRARATQKTARSRIESHPKVWDAAPDVLMRLLMESDVREVLRFASRALEDNPGYCRTLSAEQTLALLQHAELQLVVLGFSRLLIGDLVVEGSLLDAAFGAMYRMLASGSPRLVEQAVSWLGQQHAALLERPAVMARLLLGDHAMIREQVRALVDAAALDDADQAALLDALVGQMVRVSPAVPLLDEVIAFATRALPAAMRAVPSPLVVDLLASGSPRLEAFAAQLLLSTGERPEWMVIQGLLDSSAPFARRVGLGFIGALDDETLAEHERSVIALVTHPMSDVREGVRLLIRRMVADPAQARVVADELLSLLPTQPEHIAASLEATLTRDLADTIASMMATDPVPLRTQMAALLHRGANAPISRVGLWLLSLQGDAVLMDERGLLLALASHENAALRESVRPLLKALGERHPAFGRSFAEQLLGRMLSPVFGGGPYNLHFAPPPGQSAQSAVLDSYQLSRRRQGWPDDDGGLLQAPPGAPIELVGAQQDDCTSAWQDIGFPFWLAGTELQRFQADSNGWARFSGIWKGTYDSAQAWAQNSGVAVFPWWSDLKTAADGFVRTWLIGDEGARVRVIEWRVWPYYSMRATNNITLTFQACLHEDRQRIVYRYGPRDITGDPRQARVAAVGVKLSTTAGTDGRVRDFFGLHGTPSGTRPAFRTDLSCFGDTPSYPGTSNTGLLSTAGRGLASVQARFRDIGQTLLEAFSGIVSALPLAEVEGLLAHPLMPVQELAARILLIHTTPAAALPPHLVQMLLDSHHASVRVVGVDLIGQLSTASLLAAPATVHRLATHRHADVRRKARDLITRLVEADVAFGAGLVKPLLEDLDQHADHAPEVSETLRRILKALPVEILRENAALLLDGILHPLDETRKAFRVTARRVVEGDLTFCLSFSQALLDRMDGSSFGDVQQLASSLIIILRDLLAELPEDELLDEELIYGLCAHSHPEMRQAAEPLLARVMVHDPALAVTVGVRLLQTVTRDGPATAAEAHIQRLLGGLSDDAAIAHPQLIVQAIRIGRTGLADVALHRMRALVAVHGVGQMFTDALVSMLFWRETYEGAHEDIVAILEADLVSFLGGVPPRSVWRLLKARTVPAQLLGARLLANNFRAEQISLKKLAELSDHDLVAVRQTSWAFYEQSVGRLRANIGDGLGILDASWDDSRAFAFRFFGSKFDDDVLTAEVLVSIVDSTREDVQAFGRKLIGRHFGAEDGPEYLRKLSQHPAPNVELFVTNYLDQYAAGQPERLVMLMPYFKRVLARVNRGRAAKARVLAFLRQELARSAEMAAPIAELLGWMSVMQQVGDRATALELMLDITERYPALSVPIQVQPVAHRQGGRDAV